MNTPLSRVLVCCAVSLVWGTSATAGIIWSAPSTDVVSGCQLPDDRPVDHSSEYLQACTDCWNLTRFVPADQPESSNALLAVTWLSDSASADRVSPVENEQLPAPIPIELLKVPIVSATT